MVTIVHCQSFAGRGWLSHYYHFFFACLIPLIDFHFDTTLDQKCYLSPDSYDKLGPFQHTLTDDLPLCLPPTQWPSFERENSYVSVDLPSYDIYDNKLYANETIPRLNPAVTIPHIVKYFDGLISTPINQAQQAHTSTERIILVIERSVEPFYDKNKGLSKKSPPNAFTSGSTRRRIANHQELVQALEAKFGGGGGGGIGYTVVNESLEGKDMREQYRLFQSASLVVAQHGAALSNIVFMDKHSSHVVEISPPYSRRAQYFRNIAQHVGVSYSSVMQRRNRGKVNISLVLAHVECIIKQKDAASWSSASPREHACGDVVHDALTRDSR